MLGLPKSTEINKPLPKKAVLDKFKPKPDARKLFDEQISRLSIMAEISPQTVSTSAGTDVAAIYVILVILKVEECDKKNIALLSKLIDQRIIFALQYQDKIRLAVYRLERVLISENKRIDEWKLTLRGLNLGTVWENIIAEVGGIDLIEGTVLDEAIAAKECCEKLMKQIDALEKQAMNEQQPRKKWEFAEEIKRLKTELEGMG